MTEPHIPLLSPKPFGDYSPEEFRSYVQSLHREPPKAAPPTEYSVSVNKKGTVTFRIRREPKWLTSAEVSELAQECGMRLQDMWLLCLKREIEIRVPKKVIS